MLSPSRGNLDLEHQVHKRTKLPSPFIPVQACCVPGSVVVMPKRGKKPPPPQTSSDKSKIFAFARNKGASESSDSAGAAKRKITKDTAQQPAPCKRFASCAAARQDVAESKVTHAVEVEKAGKDKSIDIVEGLSTSTKDVEANTHDDAAMQASPREVGEEKDTTAADTIGDSSMDLLDAMSDRSTSRVMSPAVPAEAGDERGGSLCDPGGESGCLEAWLGAVFDEEEKDFMHIVIYLFL